MSIHGDSPPPYSEYSNDLPPPYSAIDPSKGNLPAKNSLNSSQTTTSFKAKIPLSLQQEFKPRALMKGVTNDLADNVRNRVGSIGSHRSSHAPANPTASAKTNEKGNAIIYSKALPPLPPPRNMLQSPLMRSLPPTPKGKIEAPKTEPAKPVVTNATVKPTRPSAPKPAAPLSSTAASKTTVSVNVSKNVSPTESHEASKKLVQNILNDTPTIVKGTAKQIGETALIFKILYQEAAQNNKNISQQDVNFLSKYFSALKLHESHAKKFESVVENAMKNGDLNAEKLKLIIKDPAFMEYSSSAQSLVFLSKECSRFTEKNMAVLEKMWNKSESLEKNEEHSKNSFSITQALKEAYYNPMKRFVALESHISRLYDEAQKSDMASNRKLSDDTRKLGDLSKVVRNQVSIMNDEMSIREKELELNETYKPKSSKRALLYSDIKSKLINENKSLKAETIEKLVNAQITEQFTDQLKFLVDLQKKVRTDKENNLDKWKAL